MSDKTKEKNKKIKSSYKKKSKKSRKDDCLPLQDGNTDDQRMGTDLSEAELNEQFEVFLDDMDIPDDKKQMLRSKDIKIKLTMMSTSKIIIIQKPEFYVDLLKEILNVHSSMNDATMLHNLESLWISLNSYKVSWLKKFYETPNDGLNFLIDVFKVVNERPTVDFMCLKCFRAFANCGFGLFKTLESKPALVCIATCLRPEKPSVMILAVEILTIFAFYSVKGHSNVLEALHDASKLNNYKNRFEPIIKGVKVNTSTSEHESLSYTCVRFINVLINPNFREKNSEPLKLYFCLHLRREFINYGLLEIFSELKKHDSIPETQTLIKKFLDEYETEKSDNYEEAEALIDSFGNCEEIFSQLKASVCNTEAEISLQSILGTLLIIKDDPLRNNIYQFIDKINTEIILQNDDDFCPDPTLRTFNDISLKKIITSSTMEDNHILKEKLSAQKLAYDELKMQFMAYKTNNPSKSEHKPGFSVVKDKENIHISNSTVMEMVKKKESH